MSHFDDIFHEKYQDLFESIGFARDGLRTPETGITITAVKSEIRAILSSLNIEMPREKRYRKDWEGKYKTTHSFLEEALGKRYFVDENRTELLVRKPKHHYDGKILKIVT